jgi:hypothetical protein
MARNGTIANTRGTDDPWFRTLLAAAIVAGIAWVVYRPDQPRAFYVVDFGEFLPLMQNASDSLGRMRALIDYYANEGRFAIVTYAILVAKWNVFGLWSPGWQLARAIVMLVIMALAYVLLRRLGASKLGAVVGSSVYLFSPPAVDGWIHLTMGEPLGAVITLGLAIRALRFQATARWLVEAALFGAGTAILILVKELMAPAIIFPLGLALTSRPDGTFAFPERSRRNVGLILFVAGAAFVAMVPVIVTYVLADNSAYGSLYGGAIKSALDNVAIWIFTLVPFELAPEPSVIWASVVTTFLLLVILGWRAGLQGHSPNARALLSFGLLFPLVGVLVYAPLTWFAKYYAIPFLIGAALLLGMAVTFLQRAAPECVTWAAAGSAAIILFGLTTASADAARWTAIQRRDAMILEFVADSIVVDSVVFAMPTRGLLEWGYMRAFAGASRKDWAPKEVTCDSVRVAANDRSRLVTVDLNNRCGLEALGRKVFAVSYRRVDLRRLRIVGDSMVATALLPVAGRSSR